jgi:lipid II:glycine glycyltransferase (peptidoglycan interpeptide bridge formation enzyme)
MSIQIIPNTFDKTVYNALAPHPLQAWEWGEARKQMGIKILRIGEYEGTALQHVYQITFHTIPKTKYTIGYIPRSVFPSKEVLTFLYDYGKKHNVIFFKFEPNEKKYQLPITNYKLHISPHPLFPNWTQVLDLTKSEEDILKNCKPKTRYNIRLAEKKGVTIKEQSTKEGFDTFIKLYFETTKRQKYFGHNEEYHRIVWNTLKENIVHILIAYYDNTPLVAYELFYFNNTLYYTYGGSSELHRNVMAANLIMWEAIKLGKRLGAEKFDMWGSLPPVYDQTDPWAGFTRFKEGYGTEFVEMIGSYDFVVNPLLYKTYTILNTLRNVWLKMKS